MSASYSGLGTVTSETFDVSGLVLQSVEPDHVPNRGTATLQITGFGFNGNPSVRLLRSLQPPIVGDSVDVDSSRKFIEAEFNVTGKSGTWDVEVSQWRWDRAHDAGGGEDRCFPTWGTHDQRRRSGRGATAGKAKKFIVTVNNTGKDTTFTPVWVSGLPRRARR